MNLGHDMRPTLKRNHNATVRGVIRFFRPNLSDISAWPPLCQKTMVLSGGDNGLAAMEFIVVLVVDSCHLIEVIAQHHVRCAIMLRACL